MARLPRLSLILIGLLLLGVDARAERRVALVVGNATYEAAGALANPVNDAADIATRLRTLGFQVLEGHDLAKRELERKVGDFADALNGADVGLFFYAGHGVQVDGRNYVLPVDAKLDTAVKLTLEAVPMDEILDIMEQQTKTSLVFLDACRNNPFTRGLSGSSRSAKPLPGLAQFDSTRGSFIAFSTAPGAVAMDGAGRNSPFTAALLRHIASPGQSINDMMIAVRLDVIAETRDAQRPWEQGSLLKRFEFAPDGVLAEQPAPVVSDATATQVTALGRSVGDAQSIEHFVRDGYLAPDARAIEVSVGRLYASPATIFGTPFDAAALVRLKSDWFAQWASWSLALQPGSLTIVPRGEDRADVGFVMKYEYVPRDKAAVPMAGKARVTLQLVMTADGWRIESESSQAAN